MINAYPANYKILEDDPRSTPGHSKVLNQISTIMKFMLFSSTVCILDLTLELLNYEETLKTTERSKIESCPVFSFLKLFKLGPQASIFQHPLDLSLKLALISIMKLLYCIIPPVVGVRARCCTKYQKLVLKALQWWMPWPQEPIFLHLLEPETGLGVASKNTNNVFFKGHVC